MWMLPESVNTSTRKYGVSQLPADHTHVLPVPCPPLELYAFLRRTLQTSHVDEMESYDRKKRPEALYSVCWKLNPSQVDGKSQSPTLVCCHSCLKMPTQLPISTVS